MNTLTIVAVIILALVCITGVFILANQIPQGQIGSGVSTISFPEATNYVVNENGTLKQETVDNLNKELASFDKNAQIAVLILDSTNPYSIEEYGIKLADKWKVGYKGIDNGAIIIIATKDRKVRIEVGKGLEGDLPDALVGRIIDEHMMPSLKDGNYDLAVINAVEAIKKIILNAK